MSSKNPVTAIDTILSPDKTIGGITVKPITVARWALLELVDSPFINPQIQFSTITIIPSLYIATQDISELVGYDSTNIKDLIKKSMLWAESINDYELSSKLVTELLKSIRILLKIAPEDITQPGKESNGKKQQTVG